MKTVGIILAGGLSRRFGSPKAFAKMNGRYFYDYAVGALQPYCDELIVVARPELVDRFPQGLQVIVDDAKHAGKGPLAGIYSAMKSMQATRYIVLPCDMPFINAQFIEGLLHDQEAEILAVKTASQHHPLVSVWRRSVLRPLENALNEGSLRVVPFLDDMKTKWIDGEHLGEDFEMILQNINHQSDLERGEET